jgi:hypothetical protein
MDSDVHVIAGQEPDARAAQRCRAQVTFQDVETAFHHKCDGEARCGAMPQLVAQGMDQGGAAPDVEAGPDGMDDRLGHALSPDART